MLKEQDEQKNREGIKSLWEYAQRQSTVSTQERMKARVISGWSLYKAIRNEGIICLRKNIDVAMAKDMFKAGELTIMALKPETKAEEGDKSVEVIYEKKEGSFIPRPKK